MLTCRTCIKQKRLKRDVLYSNKPSMALYLLIYEMSWYVWNQTQIFTVKRH